MKLTTNQILDNIKKNISDSYELDYFNIHQDRYRFILNKFSSQPAGKKVLDIGCYPLHLFHALDKLGYQVYGISSKHEPVKDNSKIKTCNIETDRLPFNDSEFDIILLSEVIEHLFRSPKLPLAEIKRVLKKNGQFIISTPNVIRLLNRLFLLLGKNIYPSLNNWYDEKIGDDSLYFRHNREYTMNELAKLLEDSGYLINEKKLFISYTPCRKKRTTENLLIKTGKIINYLIMLILPCLRDTLYIRAEKID